MFEPPRISPGAESQPGDLVGFGLDPNSFHVVALVQSAAGGDGALCVSHGQPGGPIEVALSVEIAAHIVGPVTVKALQAHVGATQDG